jgi:hypothetical protein
VGSYSRAAARRGLYYCEFRHPYPCNSDD